MTQNLFNPEEAPREHGPVTQAYLRLDKATQDALFLPTRKISSMEDARAHAKKLITLLTPRLGQITAARVVCKFYRPTLRYKRQLLLDKQTDLFVQRYYAL